MTFESMIRAWNIGTTNVKGWLFAAPSSPAKDAVLSNKGWALKAW